MSTMDMLDDILDDFDWKNFRALSTEICSINENNLSDEMIKLPNVYVQWYQLLARARKRVDAKGAVVARISAELSNECQTTYIEKGKKATARDLDSYVASHPDFNNANKESYNAREVYEMIKSVVSAISHKKDMLVQLNSDRRAETKLYN